MSSSELEELSDCIDTLMFEDEPTVFTEEYAVEFAETALHLMSEYVEQHPQVVLDPDFCDILLEETSELLYIQLEDQINIFNGGDDIEDDMNEILDDALNIFLSTFYPDRLTNQTQESVGYEITDEEITDIEQKIQRLRGMPQPVQRTPEWYQFRWNLITASNAWKALETQSSINQLIYEKCQPLKTAQDPEEEIKMINVNSPLHWGQKYEPLTVMIYERDYNTTVEDFGCIRHEQDSFLGASPDGIIVDKTSGRFGRMLEIKNVVSREITGIPKKEYWTQMQLQMEVCDLDDCDFLETKFTEYPDEASFLNDTYVTETGQRDLMLSVDNKPKGIILYFHTKEGSPFYSYKPLNVVDPDDVHQWEETELNKYESPQFNFTFLKFIYWKMEVISCVLVKRDRIWFKNNVQQIEKVWKIIEEERITGYEHRAPNRKQKKDASKPFVEQQSQGCLLHFTKIIKTDTTDT
jgi:putative phage-type endonuclease